MAKRWVSCLNCGKSFQVPALKPRLPAHTWRGAACPGAGNTAGLGSFRRWSTRDIPRTVRDALTRAMFTLAYATFVEEHGWEDKMPGPGEDWSDYTPEAPASAYEAAERVIARIEKMNRADITAILLTAASHEGGLVNEDYADEFGFCLGMMVMGTGVSWFDNHETFKLKVPDAEGWYGGGDEFTLSMRKD